MKNNLSAFLFSISIIVASVVLGNAVVNRNKTQQTVTVTGLGKADFTSDLIVWTGSFSKTRTRLEQAYTDLGADKKIVADYLSKKGIDPASIIFQAIDITRDTKSKYGAKGNYIGSEFTGYTLRQKVKIESKAVEKIEKVSREITALLNKGVQFYSEPPRYYYTQLEDLKIKMIITATENARLRAEKIVQNAGAELGKLTAAHMGVFQITGRNSDERYSWAGTHNTSAKKKTASITMRLKYQLD